MPVEVYGDGKQISDMVWVGDLAHVLVHALEEAADNRSHDFPIECGPAHADSYTVQYVAKLVIDRVIHEGYQPVEIKNLPMRPGEIPGDKVTADTNTLIRADVNPASFKPLGDGIRDTVTWFIENEGVTWNKP